MFTQGSLMTMEGFYDTALKVFLRLNVNDPSNANINYKIGYCYLHLPGQKAKAIPYFENAIKQTSGSYREDEFAEKNAPEDVVYLLGQAYQYAYRFEEAMVQFNKFRGMVGKWNLNLIKDIDRWTEVSKNGKELLSKPVECTITDLGDSVNSRFADYSPVISADESILIFTSRRPGTGGAENKSIHDEFFEDIWVCNQGAYGTWTKAKGISRAINTDGNEATIGLSADGQQLYIYRDDKGDGNIYLSARDGDFWTKPVKIDSGSINSKRWEPSACISADGNAMYFVSDRPGGYGGRDIYLCHRLSNQTWSKPENMGPTINTSYDEDAPFIHPDGITFFFSSTGHNSMGGFDVFYSTKVANDVWTKPVNIGYPINTTDDDIYFVTSSDGRRAYYASLRPEGKGEKDIFMVSMANPVVKSVAILVGFLKNRDGSPIPKNSRVSTKFPSGEIISSTPNEATGKFIQSLFPGRAYEITVEANGNKIFTDKFFLPQDSSYQNLGRGFFQRTIFIGDTANLFSQKKVSDTASKIAFAPMEGRILLSQDSHDVAKNLTVQLLNSQGNLISSSVTDDKGQFKFNNIPSSQKYLVKIDETNPILKSHTQFYLADSDTKIMSPSSQEGEFILFKNISPGINAPLPETSAILISTAAMMTGKLTTDRKLKNSLAKTTLLLSDETGRVIQKKITDPSGHFSFENIPAGNHYTLSIKDHESSQLHTYEIYLSNTREALIRKAGKLNGYRVFKNLPVDLNTLTADSTLLLTMKGKILRSNNANDGLANLTVNLIGDNGEIIQQAKTDASGIFKFEKTEDGYNYTVKINEQDPVLASTKKIYLANETDKILEVIDLTKRENSFKNLPANLMLPMELKETYLTSPITGNTVFAPGPHIRYPGDEKFDFIIYFPYNKKEVDISEGMFVAFMDKVIRIRNDNGSVTVMIAASSSSVPTARFSSNEALAESRASEIKTKIQAFMDLKNIDSSKISYEVTHKMQGPKYRNDAIKNRKEYEKWQFIKVIVKQ